MFTKNDIIVTLTNYKELIELVHNYISETDEMLKFYTITKCEFNNRGDRLNIKLEYYAVNDEVLMTVNLDNVFFKWAENHYNLK
jgi:hypothetical protein